MHHQDQGKSFQNIRNNLHGKMVIYKSNANISPTKKDVVPKVSEYRNQFKEWKYKPVPEEELTQEKPRKRSKVRRSKSMGALSPDRLRAAGSSPVVSPDNKRLTKEYELQNEESMPQKERVPKITHGKMKRAKSEYDANFKPPSAYSYEKGAWRGVYPPHMQSAQTEEAVEEKVPALSNWFAEVIELRRKAAEYKKRAQGTHFSREHIVQLMAKQAEMWDAVSSRSGSSTISALSLESGASARARKQQREIEVEDDLDSKSDRATMATEDDHHGSDKDFKESNSNLRQKKESRSVGITAQEKYQPKSKPERKQRKKAWTEEPMSPENQSVEDFEDEDGRIPTPVLRSEQKKSRHHFDLTTPCVGGALLTSPPAARKEYRSRTTPTSKSWAGPYQDLDDDSDDDTLVEAPSAPVYGPAAFDLKKGNIAPTPTFGMPSRDSHFLRDDSESVDQPLTTSYVHSPIKLSTSTEDKENPPQKQKCSKTSKAKRGLGIPSTVQEGFGQTYNKNPAEGLVWSIDGGLPIPRRDVDDDVLSTSARSIASSCSVASETLERARKRKEEFWGKNGIATR
ncbi:hypothetical protein KUTeg_020541 [Tegillarca granosa]|uniref:Nuclear protein MDM1 n=1 Tax=Tegillarca granosa TaxID=220873 RepID=A0ABQ9E883_TEGGR|nr:hypothetical protein KUTeg_020541 [Tegillarca granosa]